jgi:hypothetical protein
VTGARWLTLGLLGLLLAGALPIAHAEPTHGKKARPRPAASAKKPRAKARHKRAAEGRRARREGSEAAAAEVAAESPDPKHAERAPPSAQKAAQDAAQGANAEIVKEGDTSVKVMSFTGLDIEGRLKSPQLLYFVNRVHAEFDRPKLPHRSFMPELQRSTQQEPVR